MAFAKSQENRFRIDGEIAENHAILVNLTASISTTIVFFNPFPWRSNHSWFNPLSPHDALKHHFISLKTHVIFLQQWVLECIFP